MNYKVKVGILTFHRALNIGGNLQAFALQKFLEKNKINNEIIDYRADFIENNYYNNKVTLLKLKKMIKGIFKNYEKKDKKPFINFCDNYLNVSDQKYYNNNINNTNNIYDVFIVGSDQVWSSTCAGFDENYFLTFTNKKKLSYAASLGGSDIDESLKIEYKERLKSFHAISLREKSAISNIKSIYDGEVVNLIDPTLLHKKKFWYNSFIEKNAFKDKYILIYTINEDIDILNAARKIAKEKKFKILYINDRIKKPKGMISLTSVSPEKFINLVFYAEIIITNSFHGLCFSTIFKKTFFVKLLEENKKVNRRLVDFLNNYNLKDRIFDDIDDMKIDDIIDYDYVEHKQSQEIIKSVDWINEYL